VSSGTQFGVATQTDSIVTTVVPAGRMAIAAGITTMAAAVGVLGVGITTMATAALVMTTATAAGVNRALLAIRDCARLCAVP
jgi:hypothetical protein